MENSQHPGRRQFLKLAARTGLITGLSAAALPALAAGVTRTSSLTPPVDGALLSVARGDYAEKVPYTQQPLPYSYSALEPYIDAQTMELHYSKHGAAYAKSLGEALQAENVNTQSTSLDALLGNISRYSVKMRNNAGGHYNHELFWKSMGTPSVHQPSGKLADAILRDFGSFETFKTQFGDAAKTRFGSGWAWLVLTPGKKLAIGSTPNQDSPLMDISDIKGIPLLGLDVWEHAYYLKYQNRRPDYITAWWNVVDWPVIQKRFESA